MMEAAFAEVDDSTEIKPQKETTYQRSLNIYLTKNEVPDDKKDLKIYKAPGENNICGELMK
jgi:hypothetical protein